MDIIAYYFMLYIHLLKRLFSFLKFLNLNSIDKRENLPKRLIKKIVFIKDLYLFKNHI